jgi:hypothetical protein
MINAIAAIKNAMTAPSRQVKGKVSLYKGDTNALSTYSYADALQSIEISRMGGDNKFFGFGICQTATLKLKNKDNQIVINKDDYFIPQFGVIPAGVKNVIWASSVFPQFFVENVQKDEVSGTLTITAGDRLHNLAQQYRVNELGIVAPYTIRAFAEACATKLGLTFEEYDADAGTEFNYEYPEGANFDGAETLKEALNAVAEATQTIYYIDGTKLCFRSLWSAASTVLTVEKSQYFNLDTKPTRYLGAVCSATELGENIIAHGETGDATQYVRDNPFWDMLEPTVLAERVEAAVNKYSGVAYTPFTCSWRGNFLLEIGDKIGYTTKNGSVHTTPFLNDTITYDGGFRQVSNWSYEDNASETIDNPSTLGTALKQTFATVDKVNKEITMVVSETEDLSSQVSTIKMTTDTIASTVEDVSSRMDDTNESIETLTSKVNMAITADDVRIEVQKELENGVSKVQTGKGFTFDDAGLTIEDINPNTNNKITTTVSNNGMVVYRDDEAVLTANDRGVKAKDLQAETYLIIGTNSRFEDYGLHRTGCFWVGSA